VLLLLVVVIVVTVVLVAFDPDVFFRSRCNHNAIQGIFKSGDPAKRAAAIVQAVTNYNNPKACFCCQYEVVFDAF
jgi:hypothetical protein